MSSFDYLVILGFVFLSCYQNMAILKKLDHITVAVEITQKKTGN